MLCPYCSEEIKDGAKKCRYCGEFLEKEASKEEVKEKTGEKRPLWKNVGFWVLVVPICFAFLLSLMPDVPDNNTPVKNKPDPVQERLERITELMTAEIPEFEKVEILEGNIVGIFFTDMPDLGITDSIDSITRGQAVNLSRETNGGAWAVKTFVGGVGQMFCTANNSQINECKDYR